jgi:hypothetical protein
MFRGHKMQHLRNQLRHYVLHEKHTKDVYIYIDADAVNMM